MRAITLRQPWASLVALGAKSIETRSWPTNYRGPLLIHAGKQRVSTADRRDYWGAHSGHLPLGAVVASCVLDAVVPIRRGLMPGPDDGKATCITNRDGNGGDLVSLWRWSDAVDDWNVVHLSERPFGDYSPGRWAWLLSDVRPVEERCPRCWGEPMTIHAPVHTLPADPNDDEVRAALLCPTCRGGSCPPVPMRGRQGLWVPSDADWSTSATIAA